MLETIYENVAAATVMVYCAMQIFVGLTCLLTADAFRVRRDKKITVMVAARNEQDCILDCLKSLNAQDYPKELMQILIGDDRSQDATAQIVREFIADKPWFELVEIKEDWPGVGFKQNVLAQLAEKASGEILLITDADVTHHPTWAAQMVAAFDRPHYGSKPAMVSGATLVRDESFWGAMQALDWLGGMAVIKAFDTLALPITANGNNTAITRAAYRAVGGYCGIPFSITEDYKLMEAVVRRGMRHKMLFNAPICNATRPVAGWKNFLRQRNRWFQGGKHGPRHAMLMFLLIAFTTPFLVGGAFVWPWEMWSAMVAAKFCSDLIFVLTASTALGRPRLTLYLPAYFVYFSVLVLLLPPYFLTGRKVVWKDKTLQKRNMLQTQT
ncbi:MAG: glycosyltransferase [Bacteroidia bacterium]|nr:glycosyltransferase [Bacteroidia bacterium]